MKRVLAVVLLAAAPIAQAAVPLVVSHQGRLFDGADQPVEGTHDVTIRIYKRLVDNPGEENLVWEETYQKVAFTSGQYSLLLGDPDKGRSLDLSHFADAQGRWMTVQVGAGPELEPRIRIGSVPFAFRAGDSDTLGGKAPEEFAAAAHTHDVADVTGLEAFLAEASGAPANDNPRNHARYSDEEARSAMGDVADDNPLHHARFTGDEAVQAVAAADIFASKTHAHVLADLTDFAASAGSALSGVDVTGDFSVQGRFGAGTNAPKARLHVDARLQSPRFSAEHWTHFGLLGFEGARVNDGDGDAPAFHTDASGVGSFVAVDLGSGNAREFVQVEVQTSGETDQAVPAVWDVQFSDDGSNWTTVVTGFGPFVAGTPRSVGWTNVGAHRWWRLVKTNAAAEGGSTTEVQFRERSALIEATTEQGSRFSVDNLGDVRVGRHLTVGGVVNSPWYFRTTYSLSSTVSSPLLDYTGNPIPANFVALVSCAVTSTNAHGTAVWLVKRWPNETIHLERVASFGHTSSNTPEIYNDEGVVRIRLYDHNNMYSVRCTTQRL